MRTLSMLVFAVAILAPSFARADADSYYDAQQNRAARNRAFPHAITGTASRLAFIKAITRAKVVSYSAANGASYCDGRAYTFVTAKLADGRVCTSPAPTSCDSRTVSCN